MGTRDMLRYLMRRVRRDGSAAVRGTAYLSVCIAALVSFAILMPALEYQHVRGVQVSRWDVWVSGPLGSSDLDALRDEPGVSKVVPTLTLTVDGVTGPRTTAERALVNGAVTAIAYRAAAELDDGPYPNSLLLAGKHPADGEWACDWSVARRLHLHVGDRLVARAVLPDGDLQLAGHLAGIYGPTGTLQGTIVLPATDKLTDAVQATGATRWSDAYVQVSDPASFVSRISRDVGDRLLVIPRAGLEREGRTRLLREVGPFLRSGATWVAVAGFVTLALWQRSVRLTQRRGEYAVLTALGMERSGLVLLDGVEQALRLGAVSTAGILGAIAIVEGANGMYVPAGVLAGAIGAVAATVALTLLLGTVSLGRYLGRASLSDVLAREVAR